MSWWIMVVSAVAVVALASPPMPSADDDECDNVTTTTTPPPPPIPCEEAKMKCAYRVGCGQALQNYLVGCSGVLQGPFPTRCPEVCHHSLIALTSTEEGKNLMNCICSDPYCADQKSRTDICRPQVMKLISEPVVSCRVAQWICSADALCSTAFDYYNLYCKSMFHGRKCTLRCRNSISILRRQEKAAKLTRCRCDGLEDYDCPGIQKNMAKLCHRKRPHHHGHNKSNNATSTSGVHNNNKNNREGHKKVTVPVVPPNRVHRPPKKEGAPPRLPPPGVHNAPETFDESSKDTDRDRQRQNDKGAAPSVFGGQHLMRLLLGVIIPLLMLT